jgi:ubiquinone/menaquinone biosynthesis C-methylase UbiE
MAAPPSRPGPPRRFPSRSVPRLAQVGFGRAAQIYDRVRPDYPSPVLEKARKIAPPGPDRIVVDVGAGTGKWTRLLTRSYKHVLALEPNAAMRRELRRNLPGLRVLARTAESTGLPDASVELLTAAQCFHWFRRGPTLKEFRRILKPGGALVILYNNRRRSRRWERRAQELISRYARPEYPSGRRTWQRSWRRAEGFTPLRSWHYRHVQRLSPARVVELYASRSYVAALPRARRQELLGQLRSLVREAARRARGTSLNVEYSGELYWAYRLPGPARRRRPGGRGSRHVVSDRGFSSRSRGAILRREFASARPRPPSGGRPRSRFGR